MEEIPGSEREMRADLVLLAMGLLGPVRQGLLKGFGSTAILEGISRPAVTTTQPVKPGFSQRGIVGVVNRWSCGRFQRGARLHAPSTATSRDALGFRRGVLRAWPLVRSGWWGRATAYRSALGGGIQSRQIPPPKKASKYKRCWSPLGAVRVSFAVAALLGGPNGVGSFTPRLDPRAGIIKGLTGSARWTIGGCSVRLRPARARRGGADA